MHAYTLLLLFSSTFGLAIDFARNGTNTTNSADKGIFSGYGNPLTATGQIPSVTQPLCQIPPVPQWILDNPVPNEDADDDYSDTIDGDQELRRLQNNNNVQIQVVNCRNVIKNIVFAANFIRNHLNEQTGAARILKAKINTVIQSGIINMMAFRLDNGDVLLESITKAAVHEYAKGSTQPSAVTKVIAVVARQIGDTLEIVHYGHSTRASVNSPFRA